MPNQVVIVTDCDAMVEHELNLVDACDFVRIFIDYTVCTDIASSSDPISQHQKFPMTDRGSIYFFNPTKQLLQQEEENREEDSVGGGSINSVNN